MGRSFTVQNIIKQASFKADGEVILDKLEKVLVEHQSKRFLVMELGAR